MRQLLVSLIAATVLVLPAASAFAADESPIGVSPCPSGRGVVVWHYDPHSGGTYVEACV